MKCKNLILITIILLLVICVMPAAASAKTNVAEVKGKKYTDYEDAWDAVKKGGTIELLSDWKIKDTLKVSENATVTIKANGHTIDRGLAESKKGKSNGTVLSIGKKAVFSMHDGTITGGCNNKYSGGIHIKEKAKVSLYNVEVTGNRAVEKASAHGHGGGVMLDGDNAYLYLYDSHIDDNFAEEKGGGIYISGVKNCTVELDGKSSVDKNTARGGHGGGLYINGEKAKVVGAVDENGTPTCSISGNKSNNDGGAIYINNEEITLKNLKAEGNYADMDGGGIFANKEKSVIEGCIINKNKTGDDSTGGNDGGGVFVDNDNILLKDCTVTGNNAYTEGGGVFVTSTAEVELEGNVIIKGNYACGRYSSTYRPDDLFLSEISLTRTRAYIKEPSKITSEPGSIGITILYPYDRKQLSKEKGELDASIFFSNSEGYDVVWEYNESTGNGSKELKLWLKDDLRGKEAVAEVDGIKYWNFERAIEAGQVLGDVTLLSDIEIHHRIEISENWDVTIKMEGHTIKRLEPIEASYPHHKGNVITVDENAKLTLYDGTITGGESNTCGGGIVINENARVELYNTKVTKNKALELGGTMYGDGGGAVLDGDNAYLYLNNSHIVDNKAKEQGGGVYIADYENCTVKLVGDSSISSNKAEGSHGGGIYIHGNKAKVIGTDEQNGEPAAAVTGNKCDNDGGGIYIDSDDVNIKNIKITDNYADVDGGGIYADNEDSIIEGCLIKGNSTGEDEVGDNEGGGIFVDNDNVLIKDCSIIGNRAHSAGGGVFVTRLADIDLEGNVIIKDNHVVGKHNTIYRSNDLFLNRASGGNDGAHIKDPSKLTSAPLSIGLRTPTSNEVITISKEKGDVDASMFFSNLGSHEVIWEYDITTGEGSQKLYMQLKGEAPGSEVVAKVNEKNYNDYKEAWDAVKSGGTIELLSDWETNDTLKISENAKVTVKANGHTINRGLTKKIDGKANGTVLSIDKNAILDMYDGTITGGSSNDHSGGIHIKENARVNLYNVNVTGNRSEADGGDGNGGGVMLDGKKAYLYLYDSHIDKNYAKEKGGGIYISKAGNCTVKLDGNSTINDNKAKNSHGGGMYINGKGTKISGAVDENGDPTCSISSNICDNDGGSAYLNADKVVVENLKMENNYAGVDGGGIYADSESCKVKDCIITGNKTGKGKAGNNEGGGIFVDNDGFCLESCTIKKNKAHDCGGGVFVSRYVNIDLVGNLVIKENTAGDDNKTDNLYLNCGPIYLLQRAYIKDPGKLTCGEGDIGVQTSVFNIENVLTKKPADMHAQIFVSDNPDVIVYWDYDYATGRGSRNIIGTDLLTPLIEVKHYAVGTVDGKKYYTYQSAWNAVKNGGTIELLSDWNINDTCKVSENAEVTIRANGHTINRGLAEIEDSEGNGTVLSVGKNAVLNMYDGTVTGGCSDSYAGGIHIKERARVNLYNVNVIGNRSEQWGDDGNGGGVMLDGHSAYLYMYNSHIDNNYAEEEGGGIYISDVKNCVVELDGISTVNNNKARDSHGGGIYVNGEGTRIFGAIDENGEPTCSISGNYCDKDGGGLYLNRENIILENLKVEKNYAGENGGGLYASLTAGGELRGYVSISSNIGGSNEGADMHLRTPGSLLMKGSIQLGTKNRKSSEDTTLIPENTQSENLTETEAKTENLTVCGACGEDFTLEELEQLFKEIKEKDELNYVLEDGTVEKGSLDEKLSDIISIKCPECGEEIRIDIGENEDIEELMLEVANSDESGTDSDTDSDNNVNDTDQEKLSGTIMGDGSTYIIALIIAAIAVTCLAIFAVQLRKAKKSE